MRILVTAGPTREPLDPIRFISNRSTGKMGYAIAAAAAARGHDVVLVSGPVQLESPAGVSTFRIATAEEMLAAVREMVRSCDALVMAAAVTDWRPRNVSLRKIKKNRMRPTLPLERTPDILMSVREQKGDRVYVGFAAESDDLVVEARRKLEEKGLDLIVANDILRTDSGFESDNNKVALISADGIVEELPLMSKREVAERILDWVEKHKRN